MMMRNRTYFLFNAAIILVILFGVAALVKSIVMPEEVARCMLRYNTGTSMSVADSSGAPLSSAVLQGGFGAGEWGVLDNLRIVPAGRASGNLALRIALSKAADPIAGTGVNHKGVGFEWRSGYVEHQSSGCLRYSLRLPKHFEPGRGGVLPGLFGEAEADAVTQNDRFAVRFRWDDKGRAGLRIERRKAQSGAIERMDIAPFKLPAGRWVSLEQEITLNKPGRKDGLLRVWVDGKLVYENKALSYRSSDATRMQGVVGDAHYKRQSSTAISSREQAILLTPFELSW